MATGGSDLSFNSSRESPHHRTPEPPETSATEPEWPTSDWSSPGFAEFVRGSSEDEAEKHVAEYNRKREHEFPHLLKRVGTPSGSRAGDRSYDGFAGSPRSSGGSPQQEAGDNPDFREEYWDRPQSSSQGPSSPFPGWDDDEPGNDSLGYSPKGPPGGDDPGGEDPPGGDGEGEDKESEESDQQDKAVKELLLLKAINSKFLPAFANEENIILHDTVLETELALKRAEKGTRKPWKSKMTGQPLWRNT